LAIVEVAEVDSEAETEEASEEVIEVAEAASEEEIEVAVEAIEVADLQEDKDLEAEAV